MLRPDKYTDVKVSALYISGIIMQEMIQNKIIKYDDLKSRVISRLGERARDVFPIANSLLFLLGKIEYLRELDSIKVTE